jgi:hypothetical protein
VVRFSRRAAFGALFATTAGTFTRSVSGKSSPIDRAVVRYSSPETGGAERPLFIFERELSFEARVVALSDSGFKAGDVPFRRHHLQQALEQHVAESLLASLEIKPRPTTAEIESQLESARLVFAEQIGGDGNDGAERGVFKLEAARVAEGLTTLDVRRVFRRRAMASLYLDRMVTPMLAPNRLTLKRLHEAGRTPFSDVPFETALPLLEKWYVRESLSRAVTEFFQNARARLTLEYL